MRTAHIKEQQASGRKALAVLPVHYPKEILTAMEILAVELWGPPGQPRSFAVGRLQTYVCAIARNALAFLASGGADSVDGILFPHTCDSLQGLATQLADLGGFDRPSFVFQHPKGESRPSARKFVKREFAVLAETLQGLTGKSLETDALRRAIVLHSEIDELRQRLLRKRACSPLTDRELYRVLRRGEFLWPEEHLSELRKAVDQLEQSPVQQGVPLLISGYVPEPAALFDLLNDAGAFVAADDYAAVGRRVIPNGARSVANGDPFDTLVERYFAAPPCPTRGAKISARLNWLDRLYGRSNAAGVIVHEQKFCEPELFYVPSTKEHFEQQNVPLLYLEGELETELSGQTMTRVEAFVELVQQRAAGSRR